MMGMKQGPFFCCFPIFAAYQVRDMVSFSGNVYSRSLCILHSFLVPKGKVCVVYFAGMYGGRDCLMSNDLITVGKETP